MKTAPYKLISFAPNQKFFKIFYDKKRTKFLWFFANFVLFSYLSGLPSVACSAPHPAEKILYSWKNECSHPLCGKIYSTDRKSFIDNSQTSINHASGCSEVNKELQKIENSVSFGSVLLLGEVYDNQEHHKFRATFVRPPVVVMEQFTLEQQPDLDAFNALLGKLSREKQMPTFEKIVKWQTSPWSGYNYKPLFEAIFNTKTIIRAGDPPLATVRMVSKTGVEALTTQDLIRLMLSEKFEQSVLNQLENEIKEAHCGMLPDTVLPNMAFAQRYRDAVLAESTLEAVNAYGSAIVFAGNEHVRRDRGIPWYLKKRRDALKVMSILMKEVEEGKVLSEDYSLEGADQHFLADYIIFTPQAPRENPCKSFGKKMGLGK